MSKKNLIVALKLLYDYAHETSRYFEDQASIQFPTPKEMADDPEKLKHPLFLMREQLIIVTKSDGKLPGEDFMINDEIWRENFENKLEEEIDKLETMINKVDERVDSIEDDKIDESDLKDLVLEILKEHQEE